MLDFDRPLEPVGTDDASKVGRDMAERQWMPGMVLCSTAARAKQTWHAVSRELQSTTQTQLLDDLYREDAAGYVRIIQTSGAQGSLLVVGHNPMIEDVSLALAAPDDAIAEQIRRSGFPTAGLVVVDFNDEVAQIQPGRGRIVEIRRPGGD